MATPEKLEQYLQRVCRSMGGPRSLREHVRQELREHLLDAASEHRAAGLSEEAALERALAEFGEPEAVRTELEATHGHRALAVVIDKAMAWKEKTMKAKWLWSTWTHITVIGIVVLEILFCWFSMINILPKMKKLRQDGLLGSDEQSAGELVTWMYGFLSQVVDVAYFLTSWMLLVLVGLWALFEWRFKGENKTYIRLSVLGTLGVGLGLVVVLMAASMVLPFLLSMPGLERPAVPPWLKYHVAFVDSEAGKLKAALAKPDWVDAEKRSTDMATTLRFLRERDGLVPLQKMQRAGEDVEGSWKATWQSLGKLHEAILKQDRSAVEKLLEEFDKVFGPIRETAKRREK
jgi:hypothetical protein